MLRTKKKQLNLKPNRVLDKRSSRGMLFENEELRLRTIHINDEVEKGQTDIKKLRKENEYLKREIWSLRDECERLEEVLKKVYSGDPPPINELPVYQPRVRKSSTISGMWGGSRRASGVESNFLNSTSYDETEEDVDQFEQHDTENSFDDQPDPYLLEQDILDEADFEEEDLHNYDESESLICQDHLHHHHHQQQNFGVTEEKDQLQNPLTKDPQHYHRSVSNDAVSSNEKVDSQQQQSKPNFYSQTHHWHLHSPELEAVTEESENSNSNNTSIVASNASNDSNNNNNNENTTIVSIHRPPPDASFIDSVSIHSETPVPGSGGGGGGERGDSDNSYTLTPFFNPTIEITPASSSATLMSSSGGKQQPDSTCGATGTNNHYSNSCNNNNKLSKDCSTSSSSDVQDLGCVTVVPKTYQVTSELKITPNSLSNSMEEISLAQISSSPLGGKQRRKGETEEDEDEFGVGGESRQSPFGQFPPVTTPPLGGGEEEEDDERDKKGHSVSPRRPQFTRHPHPETAQERRFNFTAGHPSKLPTPPHRPPRLHFNNYNHQPTTTAKNNGGSRTLSYYSESKFDRKRLEPLYQSEPSLSSLVLDTNRRTTDGDNFLRVPELSGFLTEGYDQSVEMCARTLSHKNLMIGGGGSESGGSRGNFHLMTDWNSVNKNVVIGYLDGGGGGEEEALGVNNNSQNHPNNNNNNGSEVGNSLFSDISAQEVIDELETQFDPTLEKIAGVRMLTLPGYFPKPRRMFISLRTAVGVKMFIEKGFTLRGQRVFLIDASKTQTSIVILTGLPSSFPDTAIISFLNEFGQVTAPLERRAYKGVDISERLARMHLVRSLPSHPLNIAGYQVVAKVVGFNVPSSSNNPPLSHSTDNFDSPHHQQEGQSGNLVTVTPTPSPKQMTTLTRTATPTNTNSSSNDVSFRQNPLTSSSALPPPSPVLTTPTTTPGVPVFPSSPSSGIPKPHKKVGKAASMASSPGSSISQGGDGVTHLHHHYLPSNTPGSSGGPTATAINKRKMSVCSAVMDQTCCITPNSPNPNPKTSVGSSGMSQSPAPPLSGQQQQQKAYLGNPKKPLSRLPRSSPGSLVPQIGGTLPPPPSGYAPGQPSLGGVDPNLMSIVDSTGVKPLVRSLSFEPRRISSGGGSNRGHGSETSLADSQQFQFHSQQFHQGHHGGSVMTHNPQSGGGPNPRQPLQHQQSTQSRFYQPHGQLSQNNSSHSHFHSLDKNEALPWCGCWGNGCI